MTNVVLPKASPLRSWILIAITWVIAFDVAWSWQRVSGAHTSEFSGHPSESTHYVTGLMLRDFVSAAPQTKMRDFVENYAAHYPNVDRHISPPFFQALASGWMAVFGTGRVAIMMLMATLAATSAALLWSALAKEFGFVIATVGGVVLLSLPLFRQSYDVLLAEPLAAILLLAAALKWGRYLDEGRSIDALAFGGLCGLALLTDFSAFALLIQIPFSALLARRLTRLRQPATWAGLALSALIAGPGAWLLSGEGDFGRWVRTVISWDFTRDALPFYLGKLGMGLGFVLLLFFVSGLIREFRKPERTGRWSALLATLASALAVRATLSEPLDVRHLVPLLPIAIMFVAAGLNQLSSRFSDLPKMQKADWAGAAAAWSLAIAGLITAQLFKGADLHGRWTGYAESARQILTGPDHGTHRVLVSSDANGEGALIGEIAMREKHPGLFVQRSTQELLRTDRLRGGIRPRFETSDDLAAWFPRSGFTIVALDQSFDDAGRNEIHNQLTRAAEDHPEVFWPMAHVTVTRGKSESSGTLTVYRVKIQQDAGN